MAIGRGRDDLAKGALGERNKAQEASDSISNELSSIDGSLSKLNGDVGALQAKIKDAKARQNAIIMRGKTVQTRLGVKRQLNDHNIDDAMQRFETYERKIDDLEGQVEAYDMGQRTLSDEIADLETDDVIDEELQKLKARMGGENPAAPAAPSETDQDQSANA